MQPHLLTNFEAQKYYQNEPKFNGVYSKNNLPKIKEGTYIKSLYKYKPKGTHWIALHVNGDNVIYFDSFWVEYIPKKIKKLIGNKNMTTNTYIIQANDSAMLECFCVGFIDFMLEGNVC